MREGGLDHLGAACYGTCPAVPARTWDRPSEEGNAHLLVFGDSTDHIWHTEMCSGLLPEEQRCPVQCINPETTLLPNNLQPYVCGDGDDRCSRATCYETPETPCL